jgi:quercetin dioxygenase-like cupin family protein
MEMPPRPPTAKGPAERFTGDVFLGRHRPRRGASRVRVSAVRFTPGARTALPSHALGRPWYVTEGRGLVQSRGGELVEIRPGDVVRTRSANGTGTAPRPATT